jgi:class 3 adenylate cyclase
VTIESDRRLSRADLARDAGASPSVVDELVRRGVLRPGPDDTYVPGDVIRVEAVAAFLEAGVELEHIQAALDSGEFTFDFLHRFYPEPAPRTGPTPADLAAALGVQDELIAACYLAAGLPVPDPDVRLRADEAQIVRELVSLWGPAGPQVLVRAVRLVGEPARQVAQGWTRLFVETISDPLRDSSAGASERIDAVVAATERATRLGPRALDWLFLRHLSHAIDQANIDGLEVALIERGLVSATHRPDPAVAFVDLSGYTAITAAGGDGVAADLSDRLRERAVQAVVPEHGRLVKLLGDGAMLQFRDGASAVRAVLALMRVLGEDGLPAHAGLHVGPLVEHDGDVFGLTVNLAARMSAVAGVGQVVVTSAVLPAAQDVRVRATPWGPTALKGLPDPVELFALEPLTS